MSDLSLEMMDLIVPGLSKNLKTTDTLIDIEIEGAFATRCFGILTPSRTWADYLVDKNVVMPSNDWFGALSEQPPLSILRKGQYNVLTTNRVNTMFSNNKRYADVIDCAKLEIATGADELGALVSLALSKSRTLGKLPGSTTVTIKQQMPEDEVFLKSLIGTVGYTLDKSMPFLLATSVIAKTYFEKSNITDWTRMGNTTSNSEMEQYLRDMQLCINSAPPGVKYVPALVVASTYSYTVTVGPGATVNYEYKPNMGSLTPANSAARWIMCAVPVIDDGLPFVTSYFCHGVDENFGLYANGTLPRITEILAPMYDARYDQLVGNFAGNVNGAGVAAIWGAPEMVSPLGVKIDLTSTSNSSWSNGKLASDVTFLPYLALPVPDHHFVLGALEITDDKIEVTQGDTKILVNIKRVRAISTLFACSLEKSWYQQYFTTGFGLYQPKNSTIQKNVLEKWNALDFSTFGICVDPTVSAISPDIIYQTDLARAYKKAKEDACEANDWTKQLYATGITYGELQNRIVANPRPRAFYSISSINATPFFGQVEDRSKITWKMVNNTPNRILETGVAEFKSLSDIDLMLSDYSEGATVSPDVFTAMGVTADQANQAAKARKAGTSGYLKERRETRGYTMREQYFTPDESLSISGYPVYRFMGSPYRQSMVLRCYADLNRLGDPLVKILSSFSSSVINSKIRQKLSKK